MIRLHNFNFLDIEKQLELESDLLKNSQDNHIILNIGTPPAIVLGILNKKDEWINRNLKEKIKIIKRFSGGGTVYVDQNTIFTTFIMNKDYVNFELFPNPILKWLEEFFRPVFKNFNFKLEDNDFTIDNKKIAGNALYIKKNRFLIHSSFLWGFDSKKMHELLPLPPKEPLYRNNRSHLEFLLPLEKLLGSKENFIEDLKLNIKKII